MFNIVETELTAIRIEDRARKDIGDIQSLINSIERDGLLNPIIVDETNLLIAGERRYQACKELGHATIPCRVIQGLNGGDELIIEFVENVERKDFTWSEALELKYKLHIYWQDQTAGWGFRETADKLKVSIGGLSSDLTMAGALAVFPHLKEEATKAKAKDAYKKLQQQGEAIVALKNLSQGEQDNLTRMMKGEAGVVFKIPQEGGKGAAGSVEPASPTNPMQNDSDPATGRFDTKAIDQLPAFTYEICGWEELIVKIPDGSVGFAELDPPYAIAFNETYGQTTNIKSTETDWTVEQLYDHMNKLLKQLHTKMLDNSWVLCWTGKEHWLEMNEIAIDVGFETQPPGIWAKPSGSSNTPSTNMISTYETFLLFRKGKATFNVPSFNSVQECPPAPASQRTHQWEKPIKLYNTFFSAIGKPKSLFFSPFAGSGASMVSATLNGMTPIGCDIRQKYFYGFIKMMNSYHLKGETDETIL